MVADGPWLLPLSEAEGAGPSQAGGKAAHLATLGKVVPCERSARRPSSSPLSPLPRPRKSSGNGRERSCLAPLRYVIFLPDFVRKGKLRVSVGREGAGPHLGDLGGAGRGASPT